MESFGDSKWKATLKKLLKKKLPRFPSLKIYCAIILSCVMAKVLPLMEVNNIMAQLSSFLASRYAHTLFADR
jgi:hypothetical protein